MSLATRCSSCGTVFRVVQDQLRISEGWVRCGRCNAVFNALEGLFDLGREPPANASADAGVLKPDDGPVVDPREPRGAISGPPGEPPPERHDEDDDDDGPLTAPLELGELHVDPIDAHLFRKRGAEAERGATSVQIDKRDQNEFSDARFDSDLFADNPSAIDEHTLLMAPTTAAADLPLESDVQPDFLRRAERRARWSSGPVRAALASFCLLATAGLGLQVANHFRDTIAARWPLTKPALVAWCQVAGCSVEAPSSIDELSLETSDLTRAAGADAFVFSATLRSHSSVALKVPSIDLTLRDSDGALLSRRALAPRDFGAPGLIQPGSEAVLRLMVNAGSARVTGYKAEIFYP